MPDQAQPSPPPSAGWAMQRASDEMGDDADRTAVRLRAQQLEREAQELEDERHDEYDDPDEGGEA